jgi:hypothetical protein
MNITKMGGGGSLGFGGEKSFLKPQLRHFQTVLLSRTMVYFSHFGQEA